MNNLMEHSKAAGYAGPASRDRNIEVYGRLVSGDVLARDEMIQSNMPLVLLRVDAYLRRSPHIGHLREDMIAAGLLALCEAADAMQKAGEVEKANPTGYLYTVIDKALSKLVDEESTIVVPQRSQEIARKDNKEIDRPHTIGGKSADTIFGLLHATDPSVLSELEEEIMACCCDDIDRRIVTMRSIGDVDREIGAALGMAESTITYRRQKLYQRFKERCPEYAND